MELSAELRQLAALRRERRIALDEIVAATQIGIACLEAIEQGVLDRLPEGLARPSYIRQYAQIVDPYMGGARLVRLVALAAASGEPEASGIDMAWSRWFRQAARA
jgi:helix-turn-helix protein